MKMKFLPFCLLCAIVSVAAQAEPPSGWTDDFPGASQLALENGKPMLLMFTGSDWCGWCRVMHEEILDTTTFMEWAEENLLLVYVDFPRTDYRTEAIRKQNADLDERFDISGYPTLLLLNPSGKELRRLGYMQGGPKTFIRALTRALK